ncbi:MAG: biotin/lipoyl-binding protein [Eubacteriales bacterium]|nr:biotin/lipoyl-binding protein [Eubacteriales bacterium]
MQMNEVIATRRKLITKLGIILIIAILLLTFLSKTINNALMPKVSIVQSVRGSLEAKFETAASVNYLDKRNIYAGGQWKVEEVKVKVNEQVKKGDILAVLGGSELQIDIKRSELDFLKLDRDYESLKYLEDDLELRIKTAELDLRKIVLEEEKKLIPIEGNIISDVDGVVSSVNIEQGSSTSKGQIIFEIVESESQYRIWWFLDEKKSEDFIPGSKINITITGEEADGKRKLDVIETKTVLFETNISGKEYCPESNQYKFWVDMNKSKEILISEGQKAEVWAVLFSKTYKDIIPKRCVTESFGKYYVFVVKEKSGALGIEKYVGKLEVKIIDEDDFNYAVDAFFRYDDKGIVEDTTKSLRDGIQVYVR